MSKESQHEPQEPTNRQKFISTLVWLVGTVVVVLGVQQFLVKPFQIPSESMQPALNPGDRIMVGRLGALWPTPRLGQVVVFHPPQGAPGPQEPMPRCGGQGGNGTDRICPQPLGGAANQYFVKRIVALAGDRVAMKEGVLWRNGKPVKESYAQPCRIPEMCNFPKEITVPPGHVLTLGDNRENSDDGRFWGPIKTDWIMAQLLPNGGRLTGLA